MTEIRSTIDLMMERTRGMSLSEEEKDSLRREELTKRAKGFRIKLLDAASQADDILGSLANEPEADRKLLFSYLWNEMADGIPADHHAQKHLDIMEKLPQAAAKSELLGRFRELAKRFSKDQKKDKHKILAHEKKKLAALGISGAAVVPKMPSETEEDAEHLTQLEELKRKLLEEAAK
ncbi:MAG: hypothetical protein FJ118_07695 [Deltaproteobacteria bacterium]|nr:hypothetical protein [Deltaproteobacteria bacterium]